MVFIVARDCSFVARDCFLQKVLLVTALCKVLLVTRCCS